MQARVQTWEYMLGIRPDTSRRKRRRLPPCPLVIIALVPLKCSANKIPHWVPFTLYQGENALVTLPYQK